MLDKSNPLLHMTSSSKNLKSNFGFILTLFLIWVISKGVQIDNFATISLSSLYK